MTSKAGVLTRFVALIIDSIILAVVGGIVTAIVGDEVLGIGVGFIVGLLYNGYFWTQNNGQTPGKGLMGIRVVKTNGAKLTLVDAALRYVGYYISTFVLFLGWLWAIPDANNQTLHDKLAGTYVVTA